MGLRAKFNLMLLAVALIGVAMFAFAATPLLEGLARDEVLQSSRIMMESSAGTRDYTAAEVAPLLEPTMGTAFHPQAVSAYAAKKGFAVLSAKFTDYAYREAALNPTNPEDRAADWEADIINDFRQHPDKQEIVLQRQTPMGPVLDLARPIINTAPCLTCHSTPDAAPKSMIALYGAQNGFGWKPGEIVAAQIVSVPMAVPLARAARVRLLLLIPYAGVILLLFLLLNLLLDQLVIGPIDQMAETAEAVSLGKMDTPEYARGGADQIARLSGAINRLRRSLREALRMLSGE
jgi:protein-histidine pros-kinase